jgi:pimeloyl-ACP methyl ester carboxylesterase
MDDPTRRNILTAGAAAAAMTAIPGMFAQQSGQGAGARIYEKGSVRIRYVEAGSGFPLMLLPGGGLNATISFFSGNSPFNAIEEFKGQYRCITADLRNAPSGQSTGPVEIDRPWDSYADDQLGLMDHLGIDKFMVMGFCIGGPFIWNLLKRAPDRVVAAVLAQPVGWRPEMRDPAYSGVFWRTWGATLTAQRPEITTAMCDRFVTRMFETNPDFVFTVMRDFVRGCKNPILVLPDDVPAHPYAVAMESAMLAPNAEVSMFPWKEPKERIPLAVRQIHSFLKAHRAAQVRGVQATLEIAAPVSVVILELMGARAGRTLQTITGLFR